MNKTICGFNIKVASPAEHLIFTYLMFCIKCRQFNVITTIQCHHNNSMSSQQFNVSSQQFNVIALTLKFYKSVFIIWKVVLCVLQDWNCWGRPPPRLPRLYVPSVSQYDDSFDTLLRQIILLCNPRELLRWWWLYNYIRWPFLLVMRLSRLIGWFSLYKV